MSECKECGFHSDRLQSVHRKGCSLDPFQPKPEAPKGKCPECGSGHYGGAYCKPKPAKDAGARAPNMRLWHGDIEFIEYAAYEILERKLAEAKADYDKLGKMYSDSCQEVREERTKSAALEKDLDLAIGFLRDAKAKWAPNTTNSWVDELLAKYPVKK